MSYTKKFIYNKVNEIYKLNKSSLPTDFQRTKVFKLFAILTGEKIEYKRIHHEIYDFFEPFVKSSKKHRWLNNIIFSDIHKRRNYEKIKYNNQFTRQQALKLTREFLTNEISNYSKVPFFCFSYLYFCHPNYKHYDYNKIRTCKLNENRAFCESLRDICLKSYKKRTGFEF